MIQDISQHDLKIEYKKAQPGPDSRVLFFRECSENKQLAKNAEEKLLVIEKNGQITFPKYSDCSKLCVNTQYLFELDGVTFFRVSLSYNEKKHILEETGGIFVTRSYLRTVGPKEMIFAAITAFHISGWYSQNKFCGCCATTLKEDDKERMLYCPSCGNTVYPRINPAVIVGVVNGDKLLLTKYRDREYKKYALVAGFTEIGESFEDTVRREVLEETGLRVKNIRYYKSQPWGFADNILAGYFCEVDGSCDIKVDKEELSVAKWVSREEIPEFLEDLSLTNEMISVFRLDKEY